MNDKIAIVALGANLKDRAGTLSAALRRLGEFGIRVLAVSPFYETVPVDTLIPQPNFLNAVAALEVPKEKSPEDLLEIFLQTEREFGRVRSYKNAPRTCDLDLIFFEDETRSSNALVLPHPRWKGRAFVLVPFNDLLRSKASWCSREPWCSIGVEIADTLRTIDTSGVRRATQ